MQYLHYHLIASLLALAAHHIVPAKPILHQCRGHTVPSVQLSSEPIVNNGLT